MPASRFRPRSGSRARSSLRPCRGSRRPAVSNAGRGGSPRILSSPGAWTGDMQSSARCDRSSSSASAAHDPERRRSSAFTLTWRSRSPGRATCSGNEYSPRSILPGRTFAPRPSGYDPAPVTIVLDVVRREWEQGYRRFEAASRDPLASDRLQRQLEVVTDELRKRIGQTFTLVQLAAAYDVADAWARDVVSEHAATPGWPRTLAMVEDAAFYLYQRGAVDYKP